MYILFFCSNFFFFKQKTAYEMRISDWSSDVCSSDLEYGHLRPEAPWQWILDPIDGTKSFVTGLPIFGTLVALTYDFQPVIGVIDQPITRDRWLGAPGRPTTCKDRKSVV